MADVLAGNEFDSRQSALSAFSPLILIVGRTELPLLLFPSFLFVPPPPVFPGHGNSQIYILDGRSLKTLFFGDRDFALHHSMQMSRLCYNC